MNDAIRSASLWIRGLKEEPTFLGEVGKSLARGALTTLALPIGAVAQVSSNIGLEGLEQMSTDAMQYLFNKAQTKYRAAVPTYEQVLEDPSMSNAALYGANVFEFLPSIIGSLGAGTVGYAAAKRVAAKKMLEGIARKNLLKRGAAIGGMSFSGAQGMGDIYGTALEEGKAPPSFLKSLTGSSLYAMGDYVPLMRIFGKLGLFGKKALQTSTKKALQT